MGGKENVPENALSRKFLDPSEGAFGLLCRGFLYRRNRALTPEKGGKRTVLSGTGDSQRDSRESIRATRFAIETPIFIVRQADSHVSLEFPIRANHPIRANCANQFARITPLRYRTRGGSKTLFGRGVIREVFQRPLFSTPPPWRFLTQKLAGAFFDTEYSVFANTSLILPWAICRNVLEDFCCINFGGFSRGFSWRIFLGTFSHKNEEKKSGEKIREKIRRLKNENPRKIHSAESRP